ncbi:AAA family ATPase [Paenibacillus sp. KS-LC4]|uniref:ATP-dependent nuclease n=1 Tax=Paenibacillus sp. KS-LC4 TaxID=2979727 RepID=UPI0030CE4A44
MSYIRIKRIGVKNYRSFNEEVNVSFPDGNYKKPVAIVGYNNSGKTNFLNAILYGITEKYITKDTFTINDFHNRNYENVPQISTEIKSSIEVKVDGNPAELSGYHFLEITLDGIEIESAKILSYKNLGKTDRNRDASGASKYFKIFYVNFHEVKKELATKKTGWGNLSSFLAKHIKSIVDNDEIMLGKREAFKKDIEGSTERILVGSKLNEFLDKIQTNYSNNLRQNKCHIEFGLPEYEDIFLEMIFKIGLNGDMENLIPIDHFGDGYISMFVMAVVQAIAESNERDKCLFLFEEPESFLHENHQEYFYKTVLCGLAENGHQVIYTTHSEKMLDIFDTRGLIRFEFNDTSKQTVLKYNKPDKELSELDEEEELLSEIKDYNNYIKLIEPNLNKIIFSQRVILVEGPNDLMTYKEIIKKKVLEITGDEKYAETYLNFNNISIVPHHGKITATFLIRLCKHLGIDFFCINDFDFEDDFVSTLMFDSLDELKESKVYKEQVSVFKAFNAKGNSLSDQTKRGMITTNWRLINEASLNNLHFNIPKLESAIGYESNDKNSSGIWNALKRKSDFGEDIFPKSLEQFIGLNNLKNKQK